MTKYLVTLDRPTSEFTIVEVEAENEEDAEKAALKMNDVGNLLWERNDYVPGSENRAEIAGIEVAA